MKPFRIPTPSSQEELEAKAYFSQEGLDFPYIPEKHRPSIKALRPALFGTLATADSLYELEFFIKELLSKPTKDYLLMGLDGHGVNSFAMHYYIVSKNLAIFIQLKYGGIITADDEKGRINAAFKCVEFLFDSMKKAQIENLVQANQRLLVIYSDFFQGGWGWIEGNPGVIDPASWKSQNNPLLGALSNIPS